MNDHNRVLNKMKYSENPIPRVYQKKFGELILCNKYKYFFIFLKYLRKKTLIKWRNFLLTASKGKKLAPQNFFLWRHGIGFLL